MRKTIYTILYNLLAVVVLAQAPNKFSYQAVITDASNQILKSKSVGLRFSIIKDNASVPSLYSESHQTITSKYGQVSVEIGGGTVLSGAFGNINWKAGPYFLKTEIDPEGGTNYTITGTIQLLSVPYALYSNLSGNSLPGPKGDTGEDGNKGQTGESAYDIWLSLGNSGTKQDFINWMKGPKGQDGIGSGNDFIHFIGEAYGGGIIFHLWKDENETEHGLIISKSDLHTNIEYSNFYKSTTEATSLWDGESNTNAILEEADYNPCAALLVVESKVEGFNDWYIPAMDEMILMHRNLFTINKALSSISGGSPISVNKNSNLAEYWTSNSDESDTTLGFSYRFVPGEFHKSPKIFTKKLRAIRKF